MKNQPNKGTVKDGLPTADALIEENLGGLELTMDDEMWKFYSDVIRQCMQSYSDQQNAELREQNRKNQSRWAKDRVEQDKNHESAMMEACGKIVDLEERVKELEGLLAKYREVLEKVHKIVMNDLSEPIQEIIDVVEGVLYEGE